jgi:hypothetical protein
VRGKILKNALIVSVIAAMLASTFAVAPSFAQEASVIVGPTIDDTLAPGLTFTSSIIVVGGMGMLGYDLRLTYDPTIIQATGYASMSPFTEEWFASIATPGDVMLSYSFPLPEPVGLDTNDPVVVATIDFTVLAYGVSELTLHGVKIVDVAANEIPATLYNACFSNVWPGTVTPEQINIGFTMTKIEYRKMSVTFDGTTQTLTAQMQNFGLYPTKAVMKLRVLDASGGVVAGLTSEAFQMTAGEVKRVSVNLDVTGLDMPATYIVEYHVEYVGFTGWTVGQHGDLTSTKTVKTHWFTLRA